jgi:hypothetical protein
MPLLLPVRSFSFERAYAEWNLNLIHVAEIVQPRGDGVEAVPKNRRQLVRQSGSNAAPDMSARRTDEPQDLATETLLPRTSVALRWGHEGVTCGRTLPGTTAATLFKVVHPSPAITGEDE